VVKVTAIRESQEFENLDYPNEDEGIEKLVHAKRPFHYLALQRYYCQNLFIVDCFAMEHKGWGHSYFKHAEACFSCSRPSERISRPRAPVQQGA
jgi:hypothetical protein